MLNLEWINSYVYKHMWASLYSNTYKQTRLSFKYPDGAEYHASNLLEVDMGKAGGYMLGLYNTLVEHKPVEYYYNLICLNKQMTRAELEDELKTNVKDTVSSTNVLFNYLIIRNFQSAQNYKDLLNDLTQVLPELGEKLDVSPAFHFGGSEWIYFNKETNVITFVTDSPNRKWCDIDRLIYLAMSYKGMFINDWFKDVALNLIMTTSEVDTLYDNELYNNYTVGFYCHNWSGHYYCMPPAEAGTYNNISEELDELMSYVARKLLELDWSEAYKKEQSEMYLKVFKDTREENVIKDVESLRRNIADIEKSLRECYTKLHEKEMTLLGYQTCQGESNPAMEFMDYIETIKDNINLKVHPDQYSFKFTVKSLCKNFDPDVAEMVLSNDRWLETHPLLAELKDCFLTDKARLIFTTDFLMNSNNFSNDRNSVTEEALPNPHINRYNCFGDNAPHISKALSTSNYIQALQTIIEATKNINFNDSTVMSGLEQDLGYALDKGTKCIKLKDGRELTLGEYREERTHDQDISQSECEEGTAEESTAS